MHCRNLFRRQDVSFTLPIVCFVICSANRLHPTGPSLWDAEVARSRGREVARGFTADMVCLRPRAAQQTWYVCVPEQHRRHFDACGPSSRVAARRPAMVSANAYPVSALRAKRYIVQAKMTCGDYVWLWVPKMCTGRVYGRGSWYPGLHLGPWVPVTTA